MLTKLMPVGAVVAVVAFLVGAVLLIGSARGGTEAHDAICALRNDVELRMQKTQELLDDHPGKELIDADPSPLSKLIVSRSVLENAVNGQRRTVQSVDRSGIDC